MVDLIFWTGQALCVTGMAYGAYLSITFRPHMRAEQGEASGATRMHHLTAA